MFQTAVERQAVVDLQKIKKKTMVVSEFKKGSDKEDHHFHSYFHDHQIYLVNEYFLALI